jgi:hypothetical protein
MKLKKRKSVTSSRDLADELEHFAQAFERQSAAGTVVGAAVALADRQACSVSRALPGPGE